MLIEIGTRVEFYDAHTDGLIACLRHYYLEQKKKPGSDRAFLLYQLS
jgi:hypothetical protein